MHSIWIFINKALEKGKGNFVWGCPLFAGIGCGPYPNKRIIASKEILGHNLVKILMFAGPTGCVL